MRDSFSGLLKNLFKATSHEEILSGMLDTITHKMSIKKCLIASYGDGTFKTKISRGYSSLFQRTFRPSMEDPLLSSLFVSKDVQILNGPNILTEGDGHVFLFPMIIKKKIIGFSAMSRDAEFTLDEIRALEIFSVMAAFILHSIALEEKLRHSTVYDEETGIYNASYFKIKVSECVDRIKRYSEGFAVLYLKYRHFVEVKRKYGSSTIERSYKDITRLIKENIRSIDTLSRYGDCNFLIIFQTSDEEYVMGMAERLRDILSARVKEMGFEAGFDMGLVHIREFRKPQTIMDALEDAVYESERTGNIVVHYL